VTEHASGDAVSSETQSSHDGMGEERWQGVAGGVGWSFQFFPIDTSWSIPLIFDISSCFRFAVFGFPPSASYRPARDA
jgi:hypothetical protein